MMRAHIGWAVPKAGRRPHRKFAAKPLTGLTQCDVRPAAFFVSAFMIKWGRTMATAFWRPDEDSDELSTAGAQKPAVGFWKAGHTPTLIAAFLYFDLAFMVWVLLGPLAPEISKTLGLTPAQKGLMVALPTLAGAVLRVVNGLLVDRIGPKRSGAINQVIVITGLFFAWSMGVTSFGGTLALGVILGFAGASFAIALPLASRWYPAEHQGKAMGLASLPRSSRRCWRRCSAGTRCWVLPASR
jgi:MFS transporter, NNP family, nitrate/nitrite transporter